MKSKWFWFLIGCIISTLLSYLLVGFIFWQWNMSQMSEALRFLIFVIAGLFITLVCFILSNIDNLKD